MKRALTIAMLGALSLTVIAQDAADARREKLLSRPRLVIFNNDGCDLGRPQVQENPTVETFLQLRHTGLLDKNVDVISYCTITSGFSNTTSTTKIGNDMRDHAKFGPAVRAFQKLGTDALAESIRFAHANGMESFWSMRMNDCHDAYPASADLFPPYKKEHPEYLVGSPTKRPAYGYWSAVDYGRPEVREMAEKLIIEVIDNYDIDGIDLDFCRHWGLFGSAAAGSDPSRRELNALTDMMRNIRAAADAAGTRRNRPILILVRVMDSVEACRAMGIDLERWCDDGLVDIVAAGSEIRLNQPDYTGKLAAKYPQVKFYMVQTDAQLSGQHPLLRRNLSPLNFRAQAAAAYEGGVHGIYVYNEYVPQAGYASYLRDIGNQKALPGLNKLYYFSHSYLLPERYGRDWGRFQKMPTLSPAASLSLGKKPLDLELYLGRENPGATARLLLWVEGVAPNAVQAKFNGVSLGEGKALDTLTAFDVPESALRNGSNQVELFTRAPAEPATILPGTELLVYGVNQGVWRRLYADGFVPGKSEAIESGAYLLRDLSDNHFSNLVYPWEATPENRIELEFDAKVVESNAPDAVVLRLANGEHVEYLQLLPGEIRLKYAKKSFKLDTTSRFHHYRVVLDNGRINVSADGKSALSAPLSTPWNTDSSIVIDMAAEKTTWLGRNSLIVGSLSPQGTGAALYRDLKLLNTGVAGRLLDGALLIVHDRKDPAVSPYLELPPLASQISGDGKQLATLSAADHGAWKAAGANSSNLRYTDNAIVMDHHRAGPTLSYPLSETPSGLLEINFSFKALDPECAKAQLQAVVTIDAPNDCTLLWGYRLGNKRVCFLDDPSLELPATPDGVINGKIIVDPNHGIGELYLNDSPTPVLRNPGFSVPRRAAGISFGDGSVAIEGSCELYNATITEYID